MSTMASGTDPDTASGPMANVLESIRESALLKLALLGVGFLLFAVFLQVVVVNPDNPGLVGVWTALFPVWGTGLILVGVGGYLFIWWRQSQTVD